MMNRVSSTIKYSCQDICKFYIVSLKQICKFLLWKKIFLGKVRKHFLGDYVDIFKNNCFN